MENYRTPLSRARGLGSAKHGVGAWLSERLTSIALIPLCLWAVYSGLVLSMAGYGGAVVWLGNPVNAVLTILLLAIGFLHMQAGLRVVIEDYLYSNLGKGSALLLNLFVCGLAAALSIFSILKVAFGVVA
jgi:succinate dehydrogenase / fumarate reductase membrane anchor subunit